MLKTEKLKQQLGSGGKGRNFFFGVWCFKLAYETKEWPTRNSEVNNIQHTPLVNPDKVLMPPLHIGIKLELMKNFVKAMAKQTSNGFKFFCKKFP